MVKLTHSFKDNRNVIRSMTIFLAGVFLLVFAQAAFSGSPGAYADFSVDPAFETQVKQSQMPSEYNYYYTGRSDLPYAVIGIDPKYTLKSKYWHKIVSRDEILEKVNHLMPIGNANLTYRKIMGEARSQIGVWFSEYRKTIVKFEPNDRLTVFSPYQPNDNV